MYYESIEIKQRKAREAERLSEWRNAESIYRSIGDKKNADVCASIAKSIERGDKYRERVLKEAGKEPDNITHPFEWRQWYNKMEAIYIDMFLPNLKK